MLDYIPQTVKLQKKIFEVLQVKWLDWSPQPDGVPRVAVYPGQMVQVWLGLDPSSNPGIHVTRYEGKFGVLVLSVNDKRIEYQL